MSAPLYENACVRPLQANIDLSAIAGNVRTLKRIVGPDCMVLAVVKAGGYGLGAPWVAAAALEGGAAWLGVARVDEGVQLRRVGYAGPLLVMSYVPPEEAEAAVRNRLTLTLHRLPTAVALNRAAEECKLSPGDVAVHLKVDTGLNRFGCLPAEFLPLARSVLELPYLRLEGLMTHFADADAQDLSFARGQLSTFNEVRQEADRHGIRFELVHACNSAGALALPEARFSMVRSGILLSGHVPAPHLSGPGEFKRALSLRSHLGRVWTAEENASVGYGRTWQAAQPCVLGLVTVGYADGYRRDLSNRGEVLVRGLRCPVVGRVSMDQISVDLTHVPGAAEGDEVVLVGRQGKEEITVDDLAALCGTISYEILCGLSERVPRRYYRDGALVAECDLLSSVSPTWPSHEVASLRGELSR